VLNGIDTERFSPGDAVWPATGETKVGGEGATLRVGLLASYARWKGLDLFIEMAARVKRNMPDCRVRFYIVGGPVFETQGSQFSESELRALIAASDLSADCVLMPHQPNPERIYRGLDVVVHCSREPEPFGRVIAEAMACGRAVLASLDGGVRELFAPGVEALAATPNDAADFALKIEFLLRNPHEREALGVRARLTAVQRLSRERVGRELREIYLETAPIIGKWTVET